jgi:hypothetical protein
VPYSQNPFVYNGATLVGEDGGRSPRAVKVTAGVEKNSSFAILTHKTSYEAARGNQPFAGFRSRFDMKLENLVTTEPRGPLVDSGSAFVGGVFQLSGSFPPIAKGISIIVATDGAYLLAAGSILNVQSVAELDGGGAGGIVQLYEGNMLGLAQNWLGVDILFTDRGRAISAGFGTCNAVVPGWVVAASIGPGQLKQGCLAIPDAIGPDWAREPFVTAGGGLFAGGQLVFRQDNIVFDFLPPPLSDD